MKHWELLYMDENGNVEWDGIFTHFKSNNPIKFTKSISGKNLEKGFAFREWKPRKYGDSYFSSNWYIYRNGKKLEVLEKQ